MFVCARVQVVPSSPLAAPRGAASSRPDPVFVLARPNRLKHGSDYKTVVRRGAKCAGAQTVTYVLSSGEDRPPRFGFIVSKRVGTAVVRNTVRRRLKAVCAQARPQVRAGADIVIRALPGAGQARFAELNAQVTRCLARRAS